MSNVMKEENVCDNMKTEGDKINKLFNEGLETIREVAIIYDTKLFLK